ncbi:uncharacterized protein [Medicago truncatula]|uniref:uncharacterized protein n=1 Tax=Medicago truncatula TaxID=3880 RepID=UPI001967471F|nr:uncharacterized protein LOC120580646 [Medicago truncatula]
MVNFAQIPAWYWHSIGVSKYCINNRGPLFPNLWALWGNELIATVIFVSDQCIALEISCYQSSVYIAAIYASTYYVKRRQLWADLTYLQGCFQGPWLYMGDFNAILGAHEKRGRRPPPPLSCEDFLNWTNANILNHLPTLGTFYTWTNGRFGDENVALRLDRAVCNEEWINFWRSSNCADLVRHQSDHHPILLSLIYSTVMHASPFKFFKAWISHDGCRQLVSDTWSKGVHGQGMARLQSNLNNVKNAFKIWNRTIFCDVDRQVKLAMDEVNRIQHLIDSEGFTDNLYLQDLEAQLSLTKALNVQEELWKEKARHHQFLSGDHNTAYFHKVSKIRAATKSISLLQDGDNVITDPTAIELHILSYFQEIFSMDNNCAHNTMVDETIPSLVSVEDNNMLLRTPSHDEIREAVFALNADGAPGPDGFGGHFFQTFWDIVGLDVVHSVHEFFLGGELPPNINSNMIVLIPKIPGPKAMGNYRPIALANFKFKIVTKILADRLASITSRIISIEQPGFVYDRNISECIIIASEAINSLEKRQYGGNIALKVDISKAFDTLDWNFLIMVLHNFGLKSNIRELLSIFHRYSAVSGQIINNAKSHFFTGAMNGSRTHMIATMLGFSLGAVPFQYLGCPIFQGKPKVTHFRIITDRIKSKLATWKGRILSIMGRVQLVKSVIYGMLLYSFHVYLWPKRLLRLLDSWIKKFIWSGDVLMKKVCTVSWKVLCRPWDEGGLDIKHTCLINEALILKLSWDLIARETQWSNLFKRRYFSNGQPSMRYFKSSVWSGIKLHIGTVMSNSLWIVGNGNNIHFWTDNWLGVPLVELMNINVDFHGHMKGMVSEVIVNGTWNIPAVISDFGDIKESLDAVVISRTQLRDVLVWKHSLDGALNSKISSSFMRPPSQVRPWAASIWRAAIPPSHSFIFWILFHRKMPTDENLRTRSCIVVSVCIASRLWAWIGGKLNCVIDSSSVGTLLECPPTRCSSQVSDIFLAAILHTIHTIWWARNAVRFSDLNPTIHATKIRIHSFIALSGNFSKGKCLLLDFAFLDSFAVSPNCHSVKDIILVLWKAPSSPWLKTVFYAEVFGIILAIEYAAQKGWRHIWLESDSTSALLIFSKPSLVPILLWNRWHNDQVLGVQDGGVSGCQPSWDVDDAA